MKGDKSHNEIKKLLIQLCDDNPMMCTFIEISETVLGVYFNGRLITFPSRIMHMDLVIDLCNDYMAKMNKKGRGPYKLRNHDNT